MKFLLLMVFVGIVIFFLYRFLRVMVKLKQDIVLPTNAEEIAVIRKYPQKIVNLPIYSKNKLGIISYILILLYIIAMLILGYHFADFPLTLYLLITLPMFHLSNLLNVFAVVEEGMIFGARFVTWRKVKSFEFVRIDVKHNYYGFSSEVNDQYELKVKTRFGTLSSIVTSEEMKGKISNILEEHR